LEAAVVAPFRRRTGFAGRPLALRRCIVEILKRRDRLTAFDLACAAYGRRLVVRPGWQRYVPPSQLVSVRRALRRLVAKGRVKVLHRFRHRKVYALEDRK
jgi:hypothetical protein